MLKKTITYEDYNGTTRTEDFYFNLSKAEIAEMEMSTTGGIENMINKIVAAQDGKKIIDLFKQLIIMSYGEKSDDGKRFIKTQEVQDAFTQSEAYSVLFMELATDADAATKFINGIVPKDLAEAAAKNSKITALPKAD